MSTHSSYRYLRWTRIIISMRNEQSFFPSDCELIVRFIQQRTSISSWTCQTKFPPIGLWELHTHTHTSFVPSVNANARGSQKVNAFMYWSWLNGSLRSLWQAQDSASGTCLNSPPHHVQNLAYLDPPACVSWQLIVMSGKNQVININKTGRVLTNKQNRLVNDQDHFSDRTKQVS